VNILSKAESFTGDYLR